MRFFLLLLYLRISMQKHFLTRIFITPNNCWLPRSHWDVCRNWNSIRTFSYYLFSFVFSLYLSRGPPYLLVLHSRFVLHSKELYEQSVSLTLSIHIFFSFLSPSFWNEHTCTHTAFVFILFSIFCLSYVLLLFLTRCHCFVSISVGAIAVIGTFHTAYIHGCITIML